MSATMPVTSSQPASQPAGGTDKCPVCNRCYFARTPRRLKDDISLGRYARHVHGDYVYLHEIDLSQAGWWRQ